MTEEPIRLGVIGCGGFAQFALGNFAATPGIRIAAVADIRAESARAVAQRFLVPDLNVSALIANEGIDLVYIATPPFLHYSQGMLALQAGKHVICEKPLALDVAQAEEMIALAREKGLLLITNLMQRYNPLYDKISELIRSKILGEVLHGYFENYANDEKLPPDHWFWDSRKSGGIFIEHGVHFFDLFAGWLGPGRVLSAQHTLRPHYGVEEQVHCTALYDESILVDFYHSFTQPLRLDRQELRLLFERGDVTLYEWVPTRVRLDAVVDESSLQTLGQIFPGARIEKKETYEGKARFAHGRHKPIECDYRVLLELGADVEKLERYGQMLRSMLADQSAWIRDHTHMRRITAENGRDSVIMACEAKRLAEATIS